jgi:hypothetical protein
MLATVLTRNSRDESVESSNCEKEQQMDQFESLSETDVHVLNEMLGRFTETYFEGSPE